MQKTPMVSICMITYGHEKFIEQAINGVLMQQTNFEIELVISNDCSPDNTDEIISNIIKNHPKGNSINYIKHDNNIGMMPNFIYALKICKGTYVAFCEGDDYWIDPLKLQRQVDFLTANEEYSMCAENTLVKDEIYNIEYNFSNIDKERDYQLKDLIARRPFHTAAIVYRKDKLIMPENAVNYPFGDNLVYVILAKNGKIKFLPNISAVYRKNETGITSINKLKWTRKVELFGNMLNVFLDREFQKQIYRSIALSYYSCAKYTLKRARIFDFSFCFFTWIKYKFLQII